MGRDYKAEESHEELLGFALGAVARKRAKFYVQALAGQSLTPSQLFLLRQFWLEDGLPLRDLGLRAQLDATSTTWLIDQLEQASLVERKRNDTDRRIVRVWLTEAEIDLRPGGAIRFEWRSGTVEVGKIAMLEPPHRLSYTWEALEPSPTMISFELTAENDGTLLRLIHTGMGEGEDWDNYYSSANGGWNEHLNTLSTWVETGITPVAE